VATLRPDGKEWEGVDDPEPPSPATRKLLWIAAGVVGAVGCLLAVVWLTSGKAVDEKRLTTPPRHSAGSRQPTSVAPQAATVPAKSSDYRVIKEEIHDTPNKTMVTLRIVVAGNLSSSGLKELLCRLHAKTVARSGFEHHSNPTNVYLYAATDKERAASCLWVARSEWHSGQGNPTIEVNQNQLSQLDAPPETRLELSESIRKEIWREYVLGEDEVDDAAERLFPYQRLSEPNAKKNLEYVDSQRAKLRERLAQKHGTTVETVKEIFKEAVSKEWPLPSKKGDRR
jgi:hypothetical protein